MSKELEELRKQTNLMILQLRAARVKDVDIADALGVSPSRLSELLQPKKFKKSKKGDEENG